MNCIHTPSFDFSQFWLASGQEIIKRCGIDTTGQKIKVVCVSRFDPSDNLFNPAKPYVWEDYNGWEGRVIKESTNGAFPAYYVKISSDGVNFIKMHINKTDIEFI